MDNGPSQRSASDPENDAAVEAARRLSNRRRFIRNAATGAAVVGIGGFFYVMGRDDQTRSAATERLPDGRPRLPPGQRVLQKLKPMGGYEGDPSPSRFRLEIHGEVRRPTVLSYADLLAMPQVEQQCDVHCVTGWSVLGSTWKGVSLARLAERAGVRDRARYVVFEAAGGYTANVPVAAALAPDSLAAYQLDGDPLPQPHGPPVRSLVPQLYFWKSAKWLTGIRFVEEDEPGFWEVRGYHNVGDPWKEERYG